jgi:uncharacterized membrane protein
MRLSIDESGAITLTGTANTNNWSACAYEAEAQQSLVVKRKPKHRMYMKQALRYLCLALISVFFIGGGIAHFTSTAMFVKMISFLPFPTAVVYITGVIEFIAVAGLWVPRFRQMTGNALFVYTICVTPANVYMMLHPEVFPGFDMTFHSVRLAGQVLLLAMIWWSTRAPVAKVLGAIPLSA